jgi:hypothetical protein
MAEGPNRIRRGFHRLALFLAAPVIVLGLMWTGHQLIEPSGPLAEHVPEGTRAIAFDDLSAIQERLISDQAANGVVAPDGYIVLGMEVEREENRFHRFIDPGVEVESYSIFQLRDGREVVVGSTYDRHLTDAAYAILYYEAATGEPFPFDGPELAAGVPVSLAYSDRRLAQRPWPYASNRREPDLSLTWAAVLAALAIYGFVYGFGWVVQGFSGGEANRT